MIRAVGQASAIESLDPRTRKLLGQSPPAASGQLRTHIVVQGYPPWTPVVGRFGGQLGGQPRGCQTGNLGGIPAGRQGHAEGGSPCPTPTAITPRCTGTSIPTSPRICGMADSGRTWTPTTTQALPRRRQPCPPAGAASPGAAHRPRHRWVRGRRAVAQASPCAGGAGLLASASRGLGSRRAETTQSDYGRHLGSVPMIVLFVPHAAG